MILVIELFRPRVNLTLLLTQKRHEHFSYLLDTLPQRNYFRIKFAATKAVLNILESHSSKSGKLKEVCIF